MTGLQTEGDTMRAVFLALALIGLPATLAGCATASTVSNAPITAGMSQDFSASYDLVKAAALEAVQRLNVDVQGSDETPERFQIRFSKPISAFSWGEVGVVNIVRVDEQNTRVYVNSEKRDQMQVTGTSERQFANQIFANITESLARLQQ
jgi:hypothetical protein